MLFLLLTVVSSEPHEKPRRNNDWVAEKIHWLFLTTCHPFYIIFDCFLFVPLLPFPSDVLAEWLLYKCIDKVIFCVIVSLVNCRKYENLLQFNTSRLAFLRTWYYFRLFFWPKMDLNIRFDHPHYIGLTEHTFKDRLYKHNSFKYESKRNSTELSNFVWGKKKEKINVDLDWSILDEAKPYSPASKKCMLCLTAKYHTIFSTKNLFNKRNELVTKCRHENKFYLANYKDIPP